MADILVPDSGNLHRVLDTIEQIKDTVKKERADHSEGVAALKAQNDSLSAIVQGLEKRCNALDEALPSGEKVFRSEVAGPTSRDQKLRMFGEVITASRRKYAGMKIDKKFERFTGQGEVTSTQGGVLVPTETYDGVMQLIREKSIIRGLANVIPMTRDQMVVPTRLSGPSVEWITEGGSSMSDQSVTFASDTNSTLTTQTLVCLDKVSRELDEDSLVALEPFLADVFSQAIGAEENRVAFIGDITTESDPFDGVGQVAGYQDDSQVTVGLGVTFANLLELKYTVDAQTNGADAAWIFHPSVFQVVAGLADSDGRPLFLTRYSSGGILDPDANAIKGSPGVLFGSPVYLSSQMPTLTAAEAAVADQPDSLKTFAMYGAFKTGFAFGDRRNLNIETNDSVYFDQHAKAILASERVAMRVVLPNAFGTIRRS
jgi:HK97 family phage major capsid protein